MFFVVELITLSKSTHFVHNDLHMSNIIYDNVNKKFALLDFGRSYIDGAKIEEGYYRYIPNINLHKIPVMTDIMSLCKTLLDEMYILFFNARRAQNVHLCNELLQILKPIGNIYKVEYISKKLFVKFCKIDKLDIKMKVTNPNASVLLPGIIYLVIYLNKCNNYLLIYNIEKTIDDDYYNLPYDNFLNIYERSDLRVNKYIPFVYGNKISSFIYKENFNSDFGEFAVNVNENSTSGGQREKHQMQKLKQFEPPFEKMLQNCMNINHEQTYNNYIKSRDLDLRNLDFGDEDITIDQFVITNADKGGRRVLHLNNNG